MGTPGALGMCPGGSCLEGGWVEGSHYFGQASSSRKLAADDSPLNGVHLASGLLRGFQDTPFWTPPIGSRDPGRFSAFFTAHIDTVHKETPLIQVQYNGMALPFFHGWEVGF